MPIKTFNSQALDTFPTRNGDIYLLDRRGQAGKNVRTFGCKYADALHVLIHPFAVYDARNLPTFGQWNGFRSQIKAQHHLNKLRRLINGGAQNTTVFCS